jgi:hypothetical protein
VTKFWFRQITILGGFDGIYKLKVALLGDFLNFLAIFGVTSVTFRQIEKACDL